MKNPSILRIVSNVYSDDLEGSKEFYNAFLGMDLVMDMQWILTFASGSNPTAQISILQNESGKPLRNEGVFISIEVSDVDALYENAIKRNLTIAYPITSEPWGVRRFFVKDPNGATLNILKHEEM